AATCALNAADGWPELYDPFQVRTIYLQMEAGSSWSAVVSDADFNNPQNALLWADGETPIQVTVKRKSDPAIGQKVSVKIDINARVPGQEWHGVKKLSLENGADGGIVKEGFAWQMHRLASEAGLYGYPSAHAAWVRLIVDGQLIGVYTSVEERDKQMLENRGMWKENATWLYKNDPNPTIEAGTGDSPTFQHLCYLPFADRNLCSPPADLEADLTAWIDMQGMLTLGAIEAFTGNHDGLFTHDGKNHFFADFAPPTELKRLYFPWDLDTGISDVNGQILGSAGEYSTRILGHPWFRQWFLHTITDLIEGPLSPAVLTDLLNRFKPVLTPALESDPNDSIGESVAGHFESLREWVTNRIANVRGQIGPILRPPVFIPPAGEIIPGFVLTLSHTNNTGTIYYTLNGSDPRGVGGAIAGIAYSTPIMLTSSAHVMARVRDGTNWSALRQATFNVAN
ncbi:MAG: chitobiase/beta-hexosaminidase C-terminal domain-containing protein, partial [Phycisphaerales bacterium]|nr:chitobiase/beta-hexosaminidase C-terminal domain-containing protein [Phycisphaerales bacterium]